MVTWNSTQNNTQNNEERKKNKQTNKKRNQNRIFDHHETFFLFLQIFIVPLLRIELIAINASLAEFLSFTLVRTCAQLQMTIIDPFMLKQKKNNSEIKTKVICLLGLPRPAKEPLTRHTHKWSNTLSITEDIPFLFPFIL